MKVHRIAAFTEHDAGGNPAGVVLADRLPDPATMQRVATEIGYSETAFAAWDGRVWQTRYFSPESEVPFCGHATIALGAVLAQERGAGSYRLSLSGGEIEVEAQLEGGTATARLRSLPTGNEPVPEALRDEALRLFDITADRLDPALPPRLANAGAQHLFLALRHRENLADMRYGLAAGRDFMRRNGLVTVALIWRESPRLFHARNAFASGGVAEDPATGAAAAALAGMLRDRAILPPGEITILQGFDMGRPSRITATSEAAIGSPVVVSGAATRIG